MRVPVLAVVRSFHGLSPELDEAGRELDANIRAFRAILEQPGAALEVVAAAARTHALVVAHFATLLSAAAQAEQRAE